MFVAAVLAFALASPVAAAAAGASASSSSSSTSSSSSSSRTPSDPFSAASAPRRNAAVSDRTTSDVSYSRYPSYPPYCSTPSAMKSRSVPPLLPSERYAEYGVASTRLSQVVAVIRHGARTPWSTEMSCWDGYWQNPLTGVWDCELTTLTAPPSPPFVSEVEVNPGEVNNPHEAREGDDAMFLFEKRYDALNHPPDLANAFNGTCQAGQLLLRGYEQEITNGRHLRDAYVYDGMNGVNLAAVDERMRLFDLTRNSERGDRADGDGEPARPSDLRRPYEPPNLYYRVDDEQRTLMSGQVLLRGLFGDLINRHKSELDGEDPVIVAHTADYRYDVLAPRSNICPRVEDLWDDAERDSEELKSLMNSGEAESLKGMMTDEMGSDFTDNIVDCLMTTVCTDRPLPEVIDDYRGDPSDADVSDQNDRTEEPGDEDSSSSSSPYDDKYGPNRFYRLADYATRLYAYHLTYDDAAYSKLGMGPLWHEMLSKIRPVVDPSYSASSEGLPPPTDEEEGMTEEGEGTGLPPKLALFSGHDSTLMPLLASLGGTVYDEGVWSPYASMVIIEIHEITERADGDDASSSTLPSDHAFRLLYNGQILTPKMEGCPPDVDLCDVSILLKRVNPFATIDRDCESRAADNGQSLAEEMREGVEKAEALLSTPGGIALFVVVSAACALLGAVGMYCHLTRKLQIRRAAGGGAGGGGGGSYYSRNLSMANMGDGNNSATADSFGGGAPPPRDMQHGLPGVAVTGSAVHDFDEEDEDGII